MRNFRSLIAVGTALSVAATPRALAGSVRAEAQDANTLLAELQRSVAALRDSQAEAVNSRVDVVLDERLERINGTVDELQAAMDAIAARQEAQALGTNVANGLPGDMEPTSPEYMSAFRAHMRHGEVSAAMSVGTASDGGYLAPVEWDRTLTPALQEQSPLRNYAQVISLSQGQGFSRLYSTGQPGSGWVGETAARPATTTPTLATLNFNFGELYANPAITQQALDDVALDLEGWLNGEVATEFARQEGIAFLSGNGTNKPFGLLTYVEGEANAARHPLGAIEAITTGAAGAVDYDDVLDLVYDLPEERSANARFYTHRSSVRLLRGLKDADGNYLWQPSLEAGAPATLNGAPITTLSGMPTVSAGNIAMLYGDMRATYLIIDRVGVRVLRDPYTNKPFVHFYTTRRVGGGVQNPEYMRALRIAA